MIWRRILRPGVCFLAVLLLCSTACYAAGDSFRDDLAGLLGHDSGSGPAAQPADSTGDGSEVQPADSTGDGPADEPGHSFGEDLSNLLNGETDRESAQTEADALSYPQLTAEDIVRLDEGDAELIYDDAGRVTFIRGRYSPEKVLDHEDAAESLNYVATLLGLTKGALLFCVYGGIDYTTGYTYYLFLQRDGDLTLINAAIKIYVDPDGYTAALACSFNPSTGIREESAGKISASQAEQIVRDYYPDTELVIYEDVTSQSGFMEDNQSIHVWSVFSNNPDMARGESDLPYLQHLVSYKGDYMMSFPASTISSPLFQEDDMLSRKAKAMFEGYENDSWTGDVILHNGRNLTITVPVARSLSDGRYYLIDLDRKIIVADYYETVYGENGPAISSSDTNSGWDRRELLALYNIGRAYDYFADHGYDSVDGDGIPILILSGACNADRSPIDNTFFCGYENGFGVFGISDVNDSVESLDIMAHEFTHGITSCSMGGSFYANATGAINEAFSDIMGNLCELTYAANDLSISSGYTSGQFEITGTSRIGSSDDPDPRLPDWRIGEMSGHVYRDMSRPTAYEQPAFVRDAYYCNPARLFNDPVNDYGGVHENSSLLGNIAWVMNQHGLNYEKQYSLWMTAMNTITPKSSYADVLQALIFAGRSYGFDKEMDEWLSEAFAERGLLEDSHSFSGRWDGVSFESFNRDYLTGEKSSDWLKGISLDADGKICREGYGRVEIPIGANYLYVCSGAIAMDLESSRSVAINCPDEKGIISFLLPEGSYWFAISVNRGGNLQSETWAYTQDEDYEYLDDDTEIRIVEVKAGETQRLKAPDIG